MSTSVILQTEVFAVPTQWLIFDCTTPKSDRWSVADTVQPTEALLDVIQVSTLADFDSDELDALDSDEAKKKFIILRPKLTAKFHQLYEHGISRGSKGRLVVWFVATIGDVWSETLLRELPLDLSNFCFWFHKYIPGVVRIALDDEQPSGAGLSAAAVKFLKTLEPQYFSGLPAFQSSRRTSSSDSQGLGLNSQASDVDGLTGGESQRSDGDGMDFTSQNTGGYQQRQCTIMSNPYDTCLVIHGADLAKSIFSTLVPLHTMETEYVLDNRVSHGLGSGGNLFPLDHGLVVSTSPWRRLDWIALAQSSFLPRLYHINTKAAMEEWTLLLDFRAWKGRFLEYLTQGVGDGRRLATSALYDIIVSYPDSDSGFIDEDEDERASKRKRREANWTRILQSGAAAAKKKSKKIDKEERDLLEELGISEEEDSDEEDEPRREATLVEDELWDATLHEPNDLRVTPGDFTCLKEVLSWLLREGKVQPCVDLLAQAKEKMAGESASTAPLIFRKLEGLVRVKTGEMEAGKAVLRSYREKLAAEHDTKFLKSELSPADEAHYYNEIAAVALVEGEWPTAQTAALKAIEFDKAVESAYKTLTWASTKTGVSDLAQEDLILTYFVRLLGDLKKADEYYTKCTTLHPQNAYYKHAYGSFLYLGMKNNNKAASMFEESLKLMPSEPRFLQSYATFLLQTGFETSGNVLGYDDRMDDGTKMGEIERLYRRALEITDERVANDNTESQDTQLIIQGNFAAFLLTFDDEEHRDEGLLYLDKVLFSPQMTHGHQQLGLECWFYLFCHTPNRQRAHEALQHLKAHLRLGVRSPGWSFESHVKRAEKGEIWAADSRWVATLSQVINAVAPINVLQAWETWRKTSSDRLLHGTLRAVAKQRASANNTPVNRQPSATEALATKPKVAPPKKAVVGFARKGSATFGSLKRSGSSDLSKELESRTTTTASTNSTVNTKGKAQPEEAKKATEARPNTKAPAQLTGIENIKPTSSNEEMARLNRKRKATEEPELQSCDTASEEQRSFNATSKAKRSKPLPAPKPKGAK